MVEFTKGTICLMEEGFGRMFPDENKLSILEQGTPVKIVEIVEPDCAAMVSGKCHAPCRGKFCPRSIIVEDCKGKRWTVKYNIDGEYPLITLDNGDFEHLLQKKGWKQFKMAKWTNHGIRAKNDGPFDAIIGVLLVLGASNQPGVWSLIVTIIGLLIALYGSAVVVVGNKYSEKPISDGEFHFYLSFEKNKAALEALMEE